MIRTKGPTIPEQLGPFIQDHIMIAFDFGITVATKDPVIGYVSEAHLNPPIYFSLLTTFQEYLKTISYSHRHKSLAFIEKYPTLSYNTI